MRLARQFATGYIEGFKAFGQKISSAVNIVLLAIAYFIGIGITFLVSRAGRKRYLDLRTDTRKPSYWSTHRLERRPIDEYYRQF